MREELEKVEGKRARFRGTFARYGKKHSWRGKEATTVLLLEVTNCYGGVVADHLWFMLTKGLEALQLRPGEVVEFEARSSPYWKRRRVEGEDYYCEKDYKLLYPRNVRRYVSPKGQQTLEEVMSSANEALKEVLLEQDARRQDLFPSTASQNGVFCDKSKGGTP